MIRLVQSTWFRQIAFVAIVMTLCATAFAQYGNYGNYVTYGPPPLPVYEQPPLQDEGYIWAPGYWAYDYDYDDYYWVPGTWVQPPEPNYYWTPGYWGYNGDGYQYNEG